VEFAILVPLFLLVLLGVLEFGLLFNHDLTIEYATREGARTGAALANGTGTDSSCADFDGNHLALAAGDVDPLIIAAVQRVLESPGSLVNLSNITQVVIYRANASGQDTGTHNIWTYAKGAGPQVPCQAPTAYLDFKETTHEWDVCGTLGNSSLKEPCGTGGAMTYARNNAGANPDMLGVSISYNYQFTTPLGAVMNLVVHSTGSAGSGFPITDTTLMALEPTGS
jgi:hypothetical protein